MSGLLAAACVLASRCAPPVANLRQLNPHVAAALGDWGPARAAVPRGCAPGPALAGPGVRASTSSFGMSGVNAHAVLAGASGWLGVGGGLGEGVGGPATPPIPWRRARVWPTPRPVAALVSAGLAGAGATFRLRPGALPATSWLMHHRVSGQPLLPASALFDLALACARCLAWVPAACAPPQGDAALGRAAIATPCLLRGSAGTEVECIVDNRLVGLVVVRMMEKTGSGSATRPPDAAPPQPHAPPKQPGRPVWRCGRRASGRRPRLT